MTSAAVIVPLPGCAARSLCAPSRANSSTLAVELESGASRARWLGHMNQVLGNGMGQSRAIWPGRRQRKHSSPPAGGVSFMLQVSCA
jgi:hypothetical protein